MSNQWIAIVAGLVGITLMSSYTFGADPALKVVAWNGAPAAVSFTFDDGEPKHLDIVVPELDARGVKGTFFIIANHLQRTEEWKKVFANGHELGNHSLDHRRPGELDPEAEQAQTIGSQKKLAEMFGKPAIVYAYPFTDVSPGLQDCLRPSHIASRSGVGEPMIYQATDQPDWTDLHSRATFTDHTPDTYRQWIKETLDAKAWTILQIHSVGGNWYAPIPVEQLRLLLDESARHKLWIAPMGEVAAYWRAQNVIEGATAQTLPDGGVRWNWEVSAPLNDQQQVKVRLDGPPGDARLWQAQQSGTSLPSENGLYTVSLGAKELIYAPKPATGP